jgi:hypothetical protein
MHHTIRPAALHAAVALLTLATLVVPVVQGAPGASARAGAGAYFLVVLVPAIQLVLWTTLGWRASLLAGGAVALLTLTQAILPPRPLVSQPGRWTAGFTAPEQALRATLAPPPRSVAGRLLASGGTATLFVCRDRGPADDLDVRLEGHPLTVVRARPTEWSCWLQLAVPRDFLPSTPSAVEATLRPDRERWTGGGQRTSLAGGYTRPPSQGGRSGGAAFFDGAAWITVDLSPVEPEAQTGRYYVELRIADHTGSVREVWY